MSRSFASIILPQLAHLYFTVMDINFPAPFRYLMSIVVIKVYLKQNCTIKISVAVLEYYSEA